MKQIRQNTFETNSSSSHSITISNKGHFDANALPIVEYYKGAKNCVVLTGGEFGWGYEEFDDALTKANYLATFVETVEFTIEKFTKRDMDRYRKMLIDCIKDVTGCEEVVIDVGSPNKWGSIDGVYIDHQSEETGLDAFISMNDLKHFIFNRKSLLVIDNDNH